MSESQSQLKVLIALGKEQGYLTYAEVNDHLPSEVVDPEQIDDIINMINDMGIKVYEKAPDAEELLLNDAAATDSEDDAEEAVAQCVCTCARWVQSIFLRVKVRLKSRNASKKVLTVCVRP